RRRAAGGQPGHTGTPFRLHRGVDAAGPPPHRQPGRGALCDGRRAEHALTARAGGLGVTGPVLLSYDPNIRPSVIGSREHAAGIVEQNIRLAHVVKASREDLAWLYPELQTHQVAAHWTRLGPALVVVTDGADGASAYRRV